MWGSCLRAIATYSSSTQLNPVRENIRELNVECGESVRKVQYFQGMDPTGFVRFFQLKIQGLFKYFQGHIFHFSRTPRTAKSSDKQLFI